MYWMIYGESRNVQKMNELNCKKIVESMISVYNYGEKIDRISKFLTDATSIHRVLHIQSSDEEETHLCIMKAIDHMEKSSRETQCNLVLIGDNETPNIWIRKEGVAQITKTIIQTKKTRYQTIAREEWIAVMLKFMPSC